MKQRRLLNSGLGAHRPRRYNPQGAEASEYADLLQPGPDLSQAAQPAPGAPPLEVAPGASQDVSGSEAPEVEVAPEVVPEVVPEGVTKIADLEEWVGAGDRPARAQAVLEAELEKPKNHQRKTLIATMTDIVVEG